MPEAKMHYTLFYLETYTKFKFLCTSTDLRVKLNEKSNAHSKLERTNKKSAKHIFTDKYSKSLCTW